MPSQSWALKEEGAIQSKGKCAEDTDEYKCLNLQGTKSYMACTGFEPDMAGWQEMKRKSEVETKLTETSYCLFPSSM